MLRICCDLRVHCGRMNATQFNYYKYGNKVCKCNKQICYACKITELIFFYSCFSISDAFPRGCLFANVISVID